MRSIASFAACAIMIPPAATDADTDKQKPTCEICGQVFASRQSKSRHTRRFHAAAAAAPHIAPVDIDAIDRRISTLEASLRACETELSLLHVKRTLAAHNTFSACTGCIGTLEGTFNLNLNSGNSDTAFSRRRFDVESMVPFGALFDEFVSHAQLKACGYSIVRLMQLTHFNPEHPEHMNFLVTPTPTDMQAYALGSDRIWTEVDFSSSVLELLKKLARRVTDANPLEGRKYDDETALVAMGGNSISMNAMKGIRDHSPLAVKTLTQLGVVLPSKLVPL